MEKLFQLTQLAYEDFCVNSDVVYIIPNRFDKHSK